jgi:NAD(P)H-hydrate epimerase
MSRLTGDSVTYIQSQLINVAEEFARQYNIVCVLKDEHTITSVPYRQTYLNMSGNSGMAVAGSGDVLSGVIGSLMAQGIPAEKAAPLGVYLHGCAGDIMKPVAGERGMVASDLIEGIRQMAVKLEKKRG